MYQSSPLQVIENFLEALTNADKDGRVVVNKQGEVCFKIYWYLVCGYVCMDRSRVTKANMYIRVLLLSWNSLLFHWWKLLLCYIHAPTGQLLWPWRN